MRKLTLWLMILLMVFLPILAEQVAYAPLREGDQGQAVKAMQQRLRELKLLTGKADGIYGPQTALAVRALQEHLAANGQQIDITGAADEHTQRLLYDDLAVSRLLDLKLGDRGSRVSDLQAKLYDLRLLDTLPDGAFGQQTQRAVRAFQQVLVRAGVPGAADNGVADHVTRQALAGDMKGLPMRVPQTFNDTHPEALTPDDLYAKAALVMDMQSGEIILNKQADQRMYPASTTKIMTLLLALDALQPDQVVTIPQAAKEVPKDSSLTPVTPGEQMPARDLFYGLMLRSGNDAANALAVLCAGSVDSFVARMNEKAAALGMTATHFTNPHGYHDEQHYTTARDLARLTLAALQNAAFRDIITHPSYTMQKTRLRDALLIEVNTDLFNPLSPYYYAGAFGVKSGYTRAAGFCYVGCAQRDGRTLLAVVLNDRTRNQGWTDMGRLFNMGFALAGK